MYEAPPPAPPKRRLTPLRILMYIGIYILSLALGSGLNDMLNKLGLSLEARLGVYVAILIVIFATAWWYRRRRARR